MPVTAVTAVTAAGLCLDKLIVHQGWLKNLATKIQHESPQGF